MSYSRKKEGWNEDTKGFSSMQPKESKENINDSIICKSEEQSTVNIKSEAANETEMCMSTEEKAANIKKKSSAKGVNQVKRTPRNKQKSTDSSNISVKEENSDIQINSITPNKLEISVKEEGDINNSKDLANISSIGQVKEEKIAHGKKKASFNSIIQVKVEGEIPYSNQDAANSSTGQLENVKKESKATQSTKSSVKSSKTKAKKGEVPSTNDQKVESASTSHTIEPAKPKGAKAKSSTTRAKKEKASSINDQKDESTPTSDTIEPIKPKGTKAKSSTTRVKKEEASSISDQKVATASTSISLEPPKQKGTKAKTSTRKSQTIKTPTPVTKNLNISELLKKSDQDTEEFSLNQDTEELGTLQSLEQLENITSNDNKTKLINRSLRKEYRKLHADLTESQNKLSENKAQSIKDHVEIANELYTKVNGTFEAALDSKVLILAADMSVKLAKELKANTRPFNLDLFKNCLLNKLKIEDNYDSDSSEAESNGKSSIPVIDKERWKYFNLIASQQIQPVGGLRILTGPLSLQHKPRARRSARNKLIVSDDVTVVQEAIYRETDLDNTTTANVVTVANTLEKCGPINLFKFVINPQSYGQTIENIFFLSFLIRDGRARIEVDEDNHPILTRCKPPTHEDHRKGLTKKQWFFEIEELTWQVMVKLFDLKNSIIPHRNYENDDDDGECSPTWK